MTIKTDFEKERKEKSEQIRKLVKELERERLNMLRLQQKYEQDFDFHKQTIVNDCGRHIEELQEEHREQIRNIERKLSVDQSYWVYEKIKALKWKKYFKSIFKNII